MPQGKKLLSILVTLLVTTCVVKTTAGLKDVLFIAVDDLRLDLGTYGIDFVKSPNIDKLASESLVFDRAYCQVAMCSPSRASLFTGRRPDTNHVWKIAGDEYWRTTTNATTIPQYFKENGYVSAGIGKIYFTLVPQVEMMIGNTHGVCLTFMPLQTLQVITHLGIPLTITLPTYKTANLSTLLSAQ